VPALHEAKLVAAAQPRLHVVEAGGGLGERGEDVEGGGGARGLLDPPRRGGDPRPQVLEDPRLDLEDPLVRVEHPVLVLLELRRDEPLAAGDRLLAHVVGGDEGEVGPADLDVVAEDAVEAHLERRDARALALALLDGGDRGATSAAGGPELVELGRGAVPDESALADEGGGVVDERPPDLVGDVEGRVELLRLQAKQRRHALGEGLRRLGQGPHGAGEGDEVAGPRRAQGDPPEETVEVLDAAERLAQAGSIESAEGQLLDRVEAVLDAFELDERPQDPLAQQAGAHRAPGVVEDVEEGAPATAVGQALHELEVPAGHRVQDEGVVGPAGDKVRDVGEVALLGLAHVPQGGPRRADRAGEPLAAEGLQVGDAEVGEQLPAGPLGVEGPVLGRGPRDPPFRLRGVEEPAGQRRLAPGQDLAGTGSPDLVTEAVEAARPLPLRDRELARGGLDPRDPEALRAGLESHDEGRLARLERGGLELGRRRDHPHHLALDHPLRDAGVLHLLAQGDPEALPDEAGHVGGRRVVGHAAHRDGVAVAVARARGEGDLQGLRGRHRVVEEHLVEVAHPEEEERVRVLRLHPVVLLHGGGLDLGGRRHGRRWSIS
jgi:hypothetical protein